MKKILWGFILSYSILNAYYTVEDINVVCGQHTEKKDVKKAYQLLLQLAEQGNSHAMYEIAMMYDSSYSWESPFMDRDKRVIKKDSKKYLQWLKLSASLNNYDAIEELGNSFSNPKSYKYWRKKYYKKYPYINKINKNDRLATKYIKEYTLESLEKARYYQENNIRLKIEHGDYYKILSSPFLCCIETFFTINLIENRKGLQKLYTEKKYFFEDFVTILAEPKLDKNNEIIKKNIVTYTLDGILQLNKQEQNILIKKLSIFKINLNVVYTNKSNLNYEEARKGAYKAGFKDQEIIDQMLTHKEFNYLKLTELRKIKTDKAIIDSFIKINKEYSKKFNEFVKVNKFLHKVLTLQAENDFLLYLNPSFFSASKQKDKLLESSSKYNSLAHLFYIHNNKQKLLSNISITLNNESNLNDKDIFHEIKNEIIARELSYMGNGDIFKYFSNKVKKDRMIAVIAIGYSRVYIENDDDFYNYEKVYTYIKNNLDINNKPIEKAYNKILNAFCTYLNKNKNIDITNKLLSYVINEAKEGSFDAQSAYANYLEINKKPDDALYWYEKSANNSKASSSNYPAYYVGWEYANGNKVLQDNTLALKYFMKSSLPNAKCEIAKMYALGDGVKKDLSKSKEIIKFLSIREGNKLPKLCTKIYNMMNLTNISIKNKQLDEELILKDLKDNIDK